MTARPPSVNDAPRFADFAAFEREGWSRVAAGYGASFGRCTAQAIEPLLDAACVGAGQDVLDLACGPGYAAAAAIARGARASGLDLAPEMLALASRAHPRADFRLGDLDSLPWPDASFDAAVANFGIQHSADPARVMAEARRVLREGGRFAFTVWEPPDRSPGQRLLAEAVAAARVPAPGVPEMPPAHSLADAALATRALETAGFTGIGFRPVEVRLRAGDARGVVEIFRGGTVRLGSTLRHLGEPELERVAAEFARRAPAWTSGAGVDVPMSALVVAARRA